MKTVKIEVSVTLRPDNRFDKRVNEEVTIIVPTVLWTNSQRWVIETVDELSDQLFKQLKQLEELEELEENERLEKQELIQQPAPGDDNEDE